MASVLKPGPNRIGLIWM